MSANKLKNEAALAAKSAPPGIPKHNPIKRNSKPQLNFKTKSRDLGKSDLKLLGTDERNYPDTQEKKYDSIEDEIEAELNKLNIGGYGNGPTDMFDNQQAFNSGKIYSNQKRNMVKLHNASLDTVDQDNFSDIELTMGINDASLMPTNIQIGGNYDEKVFRTYDNQKKIAPFNDINRGLSNDNRDLGRRDSLGESSKGDIS